MITRPRQSPDPNHRLNNHWYHFTVSNSLPHQKHSMCWASKNKESFSIKTSKSLIEKTSSNINFLQLATCLTLLLPSGWLSVSASEHSSTLCKISRKVEKEKRLRGESEICPAADVWVSNHAEKSERQNSDKTLFLREVPATICWWARWVACRVYD